MLCISFGVLATVPAEAEALGEDAFTYEGDSGKAANGFDASKVPFSGELVFPEGITEIADQGFIGESGITKIVFPSTLTRIGRDAFSGCDGLKEVTIPKNVRVEAGAFWKCTKLESVTVLYEGVTIEDTAFRDCTSLKHIELAQDVQIVGSTAFTNGDKELVIYADKDSISGVYAQGLVDGHNAKSREDLLATSEALYAYSVSDNEVTVTKYHGNSKEPVIPKTINGIPVTAIGDGAFIDTTVTSVTIRDNVTSFGTNDIFPSDVTLKVYKGSDAETYAIGKTINHTDLNETEGHTVTVDSAYEDWLSVSVGDRADGSDANYDLRSKKLDDVVPGTDEKPKYITVWIEKMGEGNEFLEQILVDSKENPLPAGDENVHKSKSIYAVVAEMQKNMRPEDTSLPVEYRRFTFPMPGANITVSAVVKNIADGPTVRPTDLGGSGGADCESPDELTLTP